MEILSTHVETWSGDFVAIGTVLMIILWVACCGYIDKKKIDIHPLIIGFAIVIMMICGIVGGNFIGKKHVKYTEHKCTITNMEEFDNSKYEIVGQDGKLFTVREVE